MRIPRSVQSLRDRINRVAHVVINVTDLERSHAFYESVSPLKVVARMQAPRQTFAGLGIEAGAFDGVAMQDGTGGGATQIHLVQWKTPEPIGRHYPCFWHVGLAKIAILTPSAHFKLAQFKELGIRPTNKEIVRGYISITDPDGVILSFPSHPSVQLAAGQDPRWFERLQHCNPSVTDIARSMRFYGETLGLDLDRENIPCAPTQVSQGPGSDHSRWDSHLYIARGDGRFRVDLSQFHFPPPTADTSKAHSEAHHVGISRIGFEVDDIDACHAILQQIEPIGQAPGQMHGPEEWDFGGDVGKRRLLCFRDPDGIRLELIEKIHLVPSRECHQPDRGDPIVVDW